MVSSNGRVYGFFFSFVSWFDVEDCQVMSIESLNKGDFHEAGVETL